MVIDVARVSDPAWLSRPRVQHYEQVEKVRLLVVDDDPPIADLVATVARYEGWEAVTANSGEEALSRAAEFRPDIVVLDLMLPDLDGFGVLDRLRALGHDGARGVPHRAGRRRRPGGGADPGRRRLPGQAVRGGGADGPAADRAAAQRRARLPAVGARGWRT